LVHEESFGFCSCVNFLGPRFSLGAQPDVTVHGLRQVGWELVKKTDHNEWHPGNSPYENLRRL
jgi:hypothetical protein